MFRFQLEDNNFKTSISRIIFYKYLNEITINTNFLAKLK